MITALITVFLLAAATPAMAEENSQLLFRFEERLDERLRESSTELSERARQLLRERVVEGVRRLEQEGADPEEIAKAEATFDIFVAGVLETAQAAEDQKQAAHQQQFTAEQEQQAGQGAEQDAQAHIENDLDTENQEVVTGAQSMRDAILEFCPPPRLFPWCT